MASHQEQRRRENTTQERKMHVEKDIVPKIATQFEELASKATDTAIAAAASVDADRRNAGAGTRHTTVVIGVDQGGGVGGGGAQQMMRASGKGTAGSQFESISDKVGGLEFGSGIDQRGTSNKEREKKAYEEAIRETSHGGAKQVQHGGGGGEGGKGSTTVGKFEMKEEKERGRHGDKGSMERQGRGEEMKGGTERQHHQEEKQEMPSLEEISNYRQTAQQNSLETIQAAQERYI